MDGDDGKNITIAVVVNWSDCDGVGGDGEDKDNGDHWDGDNGEAADGDGDCGDW